MRRAEIFVFSLFSLANRTKGELRHELQRSRRETEKKMILFREEMSDF